MKRTWKQIGSLILALCVVLTMLPGVVLAEGSGTVTGQLTIGGVIVVSDLTEDGSGTGWEWDASTATLKLGSSYPEGNGIVISSQAGEIINLELSGDVKITPATGRALSIINGGLTIKANSYTLTAVSSEVSAPSIAADGNVVIESGTVVAQASNGASAIVSNSNITVLSNAHITATAYQGSASYPGNGINASGTITIEGGNVLTEGWRGVSSIKSLVISDGSLTVTGVGTDSRAISTIMGTIITGGTLTTNINEDKNGDVSGNLVVSGETTVVTVNGTVSRDLTVSGGSVAVSGSVSGTTTHTGGTLNGTTNITTEAELKAALESTTSNPNIRFGNDLTMNTADIELGANHTLNTNGKTLTITGNKRINTNSKILTINGSGIVDISNTKIDENPVLPGIYNNLTSGVVGTLNLESVTINLKNSNHAGTYSLSNINITVGNGATINVNSPSARGIQLNEGQTLTINTGGTVNVNISIDMGIVSDGEIHLNGGTLFLGADSGFNSAIVCNPSSLFKYKLGTLTAEAGASIGLRMGSNVEGMDGKFKDRGVLFTATKQVQVQALGNASATGLVTGKYFWNDSSGKFEKKPILTVTAEPHTITYGDEPGNSDVTYSGFAGEDTSDVLGGTLAFDYNYTQYGNTGEYTITPKGLTSDDYQISFVPGKLTVAKKEIGLTWENVLDRKFGDDKTVTATATGLLNGDTVSVTISYNGDPAAAGIHTATAIELTGPKASNYKLPASATQSYTIAKGDAPTVQPVNKYLLYSTAHTDVTVEISGLPANRGTTTFTAGAVTGETPMINGAVQNTSTGIKFSTNIGTANQFATIPVTITMQNYEDVIVNVTVELVDKTMVEISGVYVANKTYDGIASTYTGTPTNVQGYTGAYEYVWSSGSAPRNAGNYELTIKVPDSNESFIGQLVIPFTIEKATITITAKNKNVYVGGTPPVLSASDCIVTGLAAGETLETAPTLTYSVTPDMTKSGTCTIIVSGAAVPEGGNYNSAITYIPGTLTINNRSSGGNTTPPATPPAIPTPTVSGSTATTTVTTTTDTDGKAAASVPVSQVDSALKQAQDASAKSGEAPRVEIKVDAPANVKTVETAVPQAAMTAISSGKLQDMTISSPVANLTFDGAALNTIAGAAVGDVSFSASVVDTANLPSEVQTLIGNRPVFEFSVTSGDNRISQFGGNVTVAVPYQLGAGEDPNAVIISFINADSNLEIVTNGRYDAGRMGEQSAGLTTSPTTGTVVFNTDHFSKYAIDYKKIDFTDVADSAWYANAVTFLAARGITGGTTSTTFSPDATLSRGQFITLLLRAYDISTDENTADNFTDAGNTYYTGYLAAAKHFGIAGGVGNNKFAPEKAITRQEMFTMLYNALKALNKLPAGNSGKNLTDFTDSAIVADWAAEAMTELVKSGTVTGSGGKLDPTGGSTRAQMAQVLYNLLGK